MSEQEYQVPSDDKPWLSEAFDEIKRLQAENARLRTERDEAMRDLSAAKGCLRQAVEENNEYREALEKIVRDNGRHYLHEHPDANCSWSRAFQLVRCDARVALKGGDK